MKDRSGDRKLLETTLDAAAADAQTVTSDGAPVRALPDGMTIRDAITHIDDRGSVSEIYDKRWNWHEDPVNFVYMFTIRPGVVKGWGLHQRHEDRYFLIKGEIELVLYDVRPDSSTCGQVSKVHMSEYHRRLINIPAYVWHADHNIGTEDAIVVNMPTIMYDYSAPDKIRLPLDTPHIPYDFGGAAGW